MEYLTDEMIDREMMDEEIYDLYYGKKMSNSEIKAYIEMREYCEARGLPF